MVNRKNLTHEQRLGLLHFLLRRHHDDNLERGALAQGAAFVSVAKSTVTRLWKIWVLKHENSVNGEWDVTSGKNNNGRLVKHIPDEFVDALEALPLRSKTTIRGLARLG